MNKQIFPFLSYLKYWLVKEDQYAVQSPFVFDLYNGLLGFIQRSKNADTDIQQIRTRLLKDRQILNIEDFGAGSKKLKNAKRKTSSVTKYSTTPRKFSQLYQYFCSQTPALVVLELGTCVGINTRYLAKIVKGKLFTFEGSKALWEKAQEITPPQNTHYVLGNLKSTLPVFLQKHPTVDFVLVDATHTQEATMEYFELLLPHLNESSIMAIADIHWSKEMNMAWKKIKNHPNVIISLDFYECGIMIFDKKLRRDHYILHY